MEAAAGHTAAVAELRRWLGRMEQHGTTAPEVLPFGVDQIDAHVPTGGVARGQLHEILEGGPTSEYAGLATLFTAGILARLSGQVLWCLRGRDLFGPALSRVGLHPDRIIYCETFSERDVLPAVEEGLRCKSLAAVVGEVTRLSLTASRRLQLRAGESGVTAFAIRRWRNQRERSSAGEPTAASTRWRISPSPSEGDRFDRMLRQQWNVELLRARGGEPHSWIVGACDEKGCLALPAALADRSAATEEQRRVAAR